MSILETFVVVDLVSNRSKSFVTLNPDGSMRFNKDTAPELLNAEYIQVLLSEKEKKIAIRACDATAPNAVQFTRVFSKLYPITIKVPAVYTQVLRFMTWDTKMSYTIQGENYSSDKAIVYDLTKAEESEPKVRASNKSSAETTDEE